MKKATFISYHFEGEEEASYFLKHGEHKRNECYKNIEEAQNRFKALRKMNDCVAIIIKYPNGQWDDFVEGFDDREAPLTEIKEKVK